MHFADFIGLWSTFTVEPLSPKTHVFYMTQVVNKTHTVYESDTGDFQKNGYCTFFYILQYCIIHKYFKDKFFF